MNTTATLDQIIREYLSEQTIRENSLRTYKTYLISFYRYCDVLKIDKRSLTLSKVITVLRYVERTKSRNYHISLIIILKNYFAWLDSKRYENNIVSSIKVPRRKQGHTKDALTEQEVLKLLSVLQRETLKQKRDYAIIMLMLLNGLRCVEISRANQSDLFNKFNSIDGQFKMCLHIQRKGHTEKDDFIQIENAYHKAIEDYTSHEDYNHSESGPLFCSMKYNGRLTRQTVGKIVSSYLSKAGIKTNRITTHSLRHTAAVFAIRSGVSIYDIQKFLGHTKTEITELYTATANEGLKLTNNASESILKTIESIEHNLQS